MLSVPTNATLKITERRPNVGLVVGMHQASRAVVVLPVAGRPAEDDSASTDVSTMATRVIVKRTVHFASNSLLQHLVGYLAARVVVAMAVRPHFRVHQGHLTLAS